MEYKILKANIADVVKTNNNQEITGQIMQDALFALIENLGEGWQFGGVVKSTDKPFLGSDVRAVYLASEKGVYADFGGVSVTELSFIVYDTKYEVLPCGVAFGGDTEKAIAELAERVTKVENDGAALATKVEANTAAIASEASARESADTALEGKIATETANRTSADAAIKQDLATESTERQQFDASLASDIEVVNRKADTYFSMEETLRKDADTTLQSNIDAEGMARQEADAALDTKIGTLETNLQNELSAETTARKGGDENLQSNIDAEAKLRQTTDNELADGIKDAKTQIASNKSDIARVNRDFGRYSSPVNVTLAKAVSGKYVDKDTAQEVSASGYGISTAISLNKGDILLVPSNGAVVAACSVVSRKVTNTYDRVIVYSYTYDANGRVSKATADYDTSLVYTAHYTDDESTTVEYWAIGSTQVTTLPSTHTTTSSFYEPLVKQSVAAMPSEGYYVYLASETMDVVISGFEATVNGGVAIRVGWGIFKNIASNFVGNDGQRVLAEAIDTIAAKVKGIEDAILNGFGALSVKDLTVGHSLKGTLTESVMFLEGAGAPSASIIPTDWAKKYFDRFGDWMGIPLMKGQIYFDTANNIVYMAKGVDSVSDWKRISNA